LLSSIDIRFTEKRVFEIVAGKMDEGENPADTAIREVEEEVGFKIQPGNLHFQSSFYPSPGYSSEKIHLFSAIVRDEDKVSEGGGLDGEHEDIDIHSIPVKEFFDMWGRGELVDGKTLAGANALWHLRNQREVQIGLEYYNKLQKESAEQAK
jgi:ADP-ribose pyrophosphatase